MQCEKFELRMQERLDQRLAVESDEALVSHAADCSSCKQLLEMQEALFEGLDISTFNAPDDMAARVVSEVLAISISDQPKMIQSKSSSSSNSTWHKVLWIAMAASILLAVGIVVQNWPQTEKAPVVKSTENNTKDTKKIVTTKKQDDPNPEIILAKQTDVSEMVSHYVQIGVNSASNQIAEPPQWIQPVTRPLIPIKDSVAGAFSALRDVLPSNPRIDSNSSSILDVQSSLTMHS